MSRQKKSTITINERDYDIDIILYESSGNLFIDIEDKITKLLYKTLKTAVDIDTITTSQIINMSPSALYNIISNSLDTNDTNVKLIGKIVNDKCIISINWKMSISTVEINKTLNLELNQIQQSDVDRMSKMMISYNDQKDNVDNNIIIINEKLGVMTIEVDRLNKNLQDALEEIKKLKTDLNIANRRSILHNTNQNGKTDKLIKESDTIIASLAKLSEVTKHMSARFDGSINDINKRLDTMSGATRPLLPTPPDAFKFDDI